MRAPRHFMVTSPTPPLGARPAFDNVNSGNTGSRGPSFLKQVPLFSAASRAVPRLTVKLTCDISRVHPRTEGRLSCQGQCRAEGWLAEGDQSEKNAARIKMSDTEGPPAEASFRRRRSAGHELPPRERRALGRICPEITERSHQQRSPRKSWGSHFVPRGSCSRCRMKSRFYGSF